MVDTRANVSPFSWAENSLCCGIFSSEVTGPQNVGLSWKCGLCHEEPAHAFLPSPCSLQCSMPGVLTVGKDGLELPAWYSKMSINPEDCSEALWREPEVGWGWRL
jgi:hypothetical protein